MNDPPNGYFGKIQETCKSEKPSNITAVDRILSKCDCINGSNANIIRKPHFLYSFRLDKPPGHKIYQKLRINLLKIKNRSVPSHVTFF